MTRKLFIRIMTEGAGVLWYTGAGNTYVESLRYALAVSAVHASAAVEVIRRRFATAGVEAIVEMVECDR